jgi:Concanavalin A-like lectin/glucanases superfamily/VanZ like family
LGCTKLSFSMQLSDILENIAGFIPVGIVLAEIGIFRALSTALVISSLAEISQFVMAHRDPSSIDVAANTIGAVIGIVVCRRWQICAPELTLSRLTMAVAATLAFVLLFILWGGGGDALNARGVTSPGTLEAYWKLDENRGRLALDSSGHSLQGRFHGEPKRVPGVLNGALYFNGKRDYIEFGHSCAFRLVGSMTISAWIHPNSFPADDAAIVSQMHSGYGYQLDATRDTGSRTIGFKLTNAYGDLMARYGATALALRSWYHVAGVYDAEARRLDVYLNGKLDNGALIGPVTGTQHSSRSELFVGRRSDLTGYAFAGSIDDIRIYSFALTNKDILADMEGKDIGGYTKNGPGFRNSTEHSDRADILNDRCTMSSDPEDAKVPGLAAVFGALITVSFLGLFPEAELLACICVSFAAGLLLVPVVSPTIGSFGRWMLPFVSIVGGTSIRASLRCHLNSNHSWQSCASR